MKTRKKIVGFAEYMQLEFALENGTIHVNKKIIKYV